MSRFRRYLINTSLDPDAVNRALETLTNRFPLDFVAMRLLLNSNCTRTEV
jgi:hypothetical protein